MPVCAKPLTPAQKHGTAGTALVHHQIGAHSLDGFGLLRKVAHFVSHRIKTGNTLAQGGEPAPTRKGLYVNLILTVLIHCVMPCPNHMIDDTFIAGMLGLPFHHLPFHTIPFHTNTPVI